MLVAFFGGLPYLAGGFGAVLLVLTVLVGGALAFFALTRADRVDPQAVSGLAGLAIAVVMAAILYAYVGPGAMVVPWSWRRRWAG